MFIELRNEELLEVDGGTGKAVVELFKEVVKTIVVDVIVSGAKAAYNELTSPSHYEGKSDYRTWLN